MKTKARPADYLYLKIARSLEQQILSETLRVGDKLPSIRTICRAHGVSMSTAQFAFYELESKSLVESRPKSGYYVRQSFRKRLAIPQASRPGNKEPVKALKDIFDNAFGKAGDGSFTLFSRGVPAPALLPIAKLNKATLQAVRTLPGGGTAYEPLLGNEKLRTQVAKWSFQWKGNLSEEDIISAPGCITAISYCLMALTKRGDAIAVESPCFYGILQLAQSMGLRVVELPTNPETGVDMEALKKIVVKTKLAACLFVSNFNNPFGSLMPDEHKKAAVRLLEQHNIPLIEDDLYGDLYFGDRRPTCCKSYDESGMVLLCSSVSKTLAPAYRVGWIAPGKYMDAVMRIKLFHSLCCSAIPHEIIGIFLETGRYEAHLRKMRRTLQANYGQYVRVIGETFPEGTKLSRPQGGLSLWVELPNKTDIVELYNAAFAKKITLSPGSLFTLQNQFHDCMRLSFGLEWNDKTETALRTLGKLARQA